MKKQHGGKRENSGRKEKYVGGGVNKKFLIPLTEPNKSFAIYKIRAILNEIAEKMKEKSNEV